jgi:RNA 2',3'-cyclic 3'-phosphodiesterase
VDSFRTFIAVELAPDVRARVAQHIARLRRELPDVRASWSRDNNVHLTLKFLGNVPVADIPKVSDAVERAANTVSSFEITFCGCGTFPPHGRPKVLWIGAQASGLQALHAALEQELNAEGFPREARAFHPHLTVARLRHSQGARPLAELHQNPGFTPISFDVSEVVVFRSELLKEGSKHRRARSGLHIAHQVRSDNLLCVSLNACIFALGTFPPCSPSESSVMVQQMKQCPTCHFTFADFQRVCAFDGAELVPYGTSQSLIKVPQPQTRRPRSLKPSMSLTSLAVLVVFLSAVMIGYLKSPNPSIPAVVLQERNANSVSSTARAGRIAEELGVETRVTARAISVRSNLKRRVPVSRVAPEVNRVVNRPPNATIARQPEVQQTSVVNRSPKAAIARRPEVQQTSAVNRSPKAAIARQPEIQQTSRDKPPKVVAILKTTWKVLKKPFDF